MTRLSRRAVFAALLLTGSPTEIRERPDGVSISVTFDSIAEIRGWLASAGLDTPALLVSGVSTWTASDGQQFRTLTAWPTWHGWEIFAHGTEPVGESAALDEQTRAGLASLTVPPDRVYRDEIADILTAADAGVGAEPC